MSSALDAAREPCRCQVLNKERRLVGWKVITLTIRIILQGIRCCHLGDGHAWASAVPWHRQRRHCHIRARATRKHDQHRQIPTSWLSEAIVRHIFSSFLSKFLLRLRLMECCWAFESDRRPTFAQIARSLVSKTDDRFKQVMHCF